MTTSFSSFGIRVLVPVVFVAHHLDILAGNDPGDLERTGAGRLLAELRPVLADRVVLRRADHQHAGQQIRQETERIFRRHDDRVVVGLLVGIDHRHRRLDDRRGRRVVVRRFLVIDPVQVPDHRVGVEVGAVMELHPLPHGEDPAQRIGFVDLPGGEQARRDVGRLVRIVPQVPVHQRVVGRVAEEAVSLETIIRNPVRAGQVRRGHGDAQRAAGRRQGGKRRRRGGGGDAGK